MPGGFSQVVTKYGARGGVTYSIDIWHTELSKKRTIQGAVSDVVFHLAQMQLLQWNKDWEKRVELDKAKERVKETRLHADQQKAIAEAATKNALAVQSQMANILKDSVVTNPKINWEEMKQRTSFSEGAPRRPASPPKTDAPKKLLTTAPREPLPEDLHFLPSLDLIDKIIRSRGDAKRAEAKARFDAAHLGWVEARDAVRRRNEEITVENASAQKRADEEWAARVKVQESLHNSAVSAWEVRRNDFRLKQDQHNAAIDQQKAIYLSKDPDAILWYCEKVLSTAQYPDEFPNAWTLEFNEDSGALLVEYALPSPDALPTLVEVKFVAGKISEKHLSATQSAKLYDEVIYQIALRTIRDLLEADAAQSLSSVAFNGYVTMIDKGTGNPSTSCILSLFVKREAVEEINFAEVDPKLCFRQLKGVGSAKLHSVTAVAPIVQMNRQDKRFVDSHSVVGDLDSGYNLAEMDWEDFEHLIRELFATEFSSNGGEVKITQASRDGGVDAVAFDPDPIRGGKIVIQAKRYNHTVGVSAVRDLYGTVHNEGAIKGILVTTSDYGPDAYEFAKNKPLSLMNGANLLHLLEKHGHRARIQYSGKTKGGIK